jgi:hypothetical protein
MDACFARRRRFPMAIGDTVVRGIDQVDPKFTLSLRIAGETGRDRTTIVSPETERYEIQSRWHSDNDSL